MSSKTGSQNGSARPLVSIIVPAYNVEQYIETCLYSLLSQSLSSIEVIVVDDGSPDRSGDIAERYAFSDSRVKVIRQHNQGLGFARNTGLQRASGDYVGFVDSDDWVDEGMYQSLLELAKSTQSDAVYSGLRLVSPDGSARVIEHPFSGRTLSGQSEIRMLQRYFYGGAPEDCRCDLVPVSVCSAIYNRDFLIRNNLLFDRACHYEDGFFNIFVCQKAHRISMSSYVYYNYRKDGQSSITSSFDQSSLSDTLTVFSDLLQMARSESPEEYARVCLNHASRTVQAGSRSLIFKILQSSLSNSDKRLLMNKINRSRVLLDATRGYPFSKLPRWEAVVAICMRYNLHIALRFLAAIREIARQN